MSPASHTIAISLAGADSNVRDLNVSVSEQDSTSDPSQDGLHLVRNILPDDLLEACHPPELSGVVRLTYPLRKRNAMGLLTDWAGVDLLLSTHLAKVRVRLAPWMVWMVGCLDVWTFVVALPLLSPNSSCACTAATTRHGVSCSCS